ncbi:MAG: nickel-binding protein, partial [Paracoccaceae bacterium]
SEEVLEAMRSEGKNIMQEQSYVIGDAIYCVYNADSEELVREHAERAGVPANDISEVSTVIKHNTSFVS